jgi:hypothetical protein
MMKRLLLMGFVLSAIALSAIEGKAVEVGIPASGLVDGRGCFLTPHGPSCFASATITGPDFSLTSAVLLITGLLALAMKQRKSTLKHHR